jgi:hypothetical protein
LATGEVTASPAQTPAQLPHHKVKIKKAGQRACNEKNEKGKFCGGHLKRWFYTTDVIEQACGDAEKAWGPECRSLPLRALQDAVSPESGGREDQRGRAGNRFGVRVDAAAEEIRQATSY